MSSCFYGNIHIIAYPPSPIDTNFSVVLRTLDRLVMKFNWLIKQLLLIVVA
jgi:hypothetical protein